MDKEKLYKENENMIYNFSHSISRISGIDVHELISEANFIFVQCCNRWDINKSNGAKFSSYLSQTLYFDLFRYARKNCERRNCEISIESLIENDIPIENKFMVIDEFERDIIVEMSFQNISRDAKLCRDLVLDPPKDMIEMIERKDNTVWSKKITKTLIKKYLKNQGWKNSRISHAFREISLSLN